MSWEVNQTNPALDLMAQARVAVNPESQSLAPPPPPAAPVNPLGAQTMQRQGAAKGPGDANPDDLVSWGGGRVASSMVPRLEEMNKRYGGLRLTSSYRSPAENARTPGAAKKSNHMTGHAADFVGSSKTMNEAAVWAKQNGAKEAMVHNAGTGYHLHVSW